MSSFPPKKNRIDDSFIKLIINLKISDQCISICKFSWIFHKDESSPPSFPSKNARLSACLPACFSNMSAANLAYNAAAPLVSALSHLCQLHDCHDLGRQEYYTATWKEANTWVKLSAQLKHNAGLFSASVHKAPSALTHAISGWRHTSYERRKNITLRSV